MATVTISTPVEAHSDEYILLHGVRWSTYEALLEDLEGCHKRFTYDDESLEILTISPRHDWSKKLIGRMIEAMTEELNIPIRSGGSTTLKQQLKKKGLEPDECYWIANEPLVRGRADLDLQTELGRFLEASQTMNETRWIRAFRMGPRRSGAFCSRV